jgi:hypothetical protein
MTDYAMMCDNDLGRIEWLNFHQYKPEYIIEG